MAGAVLSRPRWYRGLEPAARGLAWLTARHGGGLSALPALSPESFHRQARGRRGDTLLGGEDQGRPPLPPCQAPDWPAPDEDEAGRVAATANLDLDSATSLLAKRLQEAGSSLTEVKGPADLARRLAAEAGPLWLEDHPWLHPVAGGTRKAGSQAPYSPGRLGPDSRYRGYRGFGGYSGNRERPGGFRRRTRGRPGLSGRKADRSASPGIVPA